ncbi:MAG: c-type cytochrome [Pseudomonadota bacterium]
MKEETTPLVGWFASVVKVLLVPGMTLLASCTPQGDTARPGTKPPSAFLTVPAASPLGEMAGAAQYDASLEISNPFARDSRAVVEGRRLFVAMNCAGCHGYDAGGAMGPNLTDTAWRYGGTPGGIFQSIHSGRPQGMPAWGLALPAQDIWKIVAYLQTLGATLAPADYHAGLQGDHDVTSVAPQPRQLLETYAAAHVDAKP